MKGYCRMVLGACVLLTACAGPGVDIALSASESINPSPDHIALPVVVRVYELSDKEAFEHASFHELWKEDVYTLGPSLIARKEVVVNPGDRHDLLFADDDKAKFVATLATFREPVENQWRAVRSLEHRHFPFRQVISLRLSGNEIKIDG